MPPRPRRPRSRASRAVIASIVGASLLAACSSASPGGVEAAQRRVDTAKRAVADAEAALEQAGEAFCAETKDYVLAIDRYGKAFDQEEATVGDLQTLGADLAEPRESTVAAAQAVLDAHDAVNEANQDLADAKADLKEARASASGTPGKTVEPSPTPSPSAPAIPQASIDRVRTAESELEDAVSSIGADTTISEATETFTSAAFALEVSWLNLFADAGCIPDDRSEDSAAAIRQYTLAVQTDLQAAGYLEAEVDGVYGPATVSAVEDLQSDAGLPMTGLLDRPTRDALNEAVAQTGASTDAQERIEATSVQTTLKLAGYWPGPIDGEWSPELEEALKEFQRALGVEPTGAVDAATLVALENALVDLRTAEPSESPEPSASASAG